MNAFVFKRVLSTLVFQRDDVTGLAGRPTGILDERSQSFESVPVRLTLSRRDDGETDSARALQTTEGRSYVGNV